MKTKPKTKPLVSYEYDLAYGDDTAAQNGMVMFRIACEGKILAEIHMPPDEFLTMAHSIESVARGVANDPAWQDG